MLAYATPVPILVLLIVIALVILLAAMLVVGQFVGLWIQVIVSHAGVSFADIIRMRLKGDDFRTIILTRIRLNKAGAEVPLEQLITHARAGGNLPASATAIISARAAGRRLPWDLAAQADLAGLDAPGLTAEALGKTPPRQGKTELEEAFVRAVAHAAPAPTPAQTPAAATASRG